MLTEGQLLQSGNYKIVRRIGGGGFGLTYLAMDSFLDRRVVIKTPNDTFQADQDYERFVRRFQREGQTLAKIKHPNVVSVIGFFEEAGMPCLVMAYVEGKTLYERWRGASPLGEDEAVRIFQKLAVALHQVHQAGIFHCDIHPGNIILQRTGEPVLIDFGSAKRLQPATVTVTTTINESFSPYEQRNSENSPKATLDVYGLAASLFFAVTGTKPLPSINRKLYGDTLAFSSTTESAPSQWLRKAILKGMALEEQNRPSNMQAFERLLYVPTVQFAAQVSIPTPAVEKQISSQRQRTSEVQRKTSYRQNEVQTASDKFLRGNQRISRKRKVAFPWLSLSLFLLGNIPTGAYMWLFKEPLDTATETWTLVSAGLLSISLGGGAAFLGAETFARARVWTMAGVWIGVWTVAGVWSLVGTKAMVAAGTTATAVVLAWTCAEAVAMTLAMAWAWILIGALALAIAWILVGTGVWAGAGAAFLGVLWAVNDAYHADARWAGIGGSAIALTGLMAGLYTSLLDTNMRSVVVVLCLLQIVLLVGSLRFATRSLSGFDNSKVLLFVILNAACILGMLGGAVLAAWFTATNAAA